MEIGEQSKITRRELFLSQSLETESVASWQKQRPRQKLLLFVSSTFTDTYKERNILQDTILPELRKRATEHGIQLLFYDMRFGIKDESSLDHTTWKCCQDGIVDCYEESDGLFFLSLQGDKYGYRPLPKLIDREFFEKAVEQSSGDKDLLRRSHDWYRLNENFAPPKFELQNLHPDNEKEYWNVVLPELRDRLLSGYSFDASLPELLIGRSITEWEALLAEHLGKSGTHSLWIEKKFEVDVGTSETSINPYHFHDTVEDDRIDGFLTSLKDKMKTCFEVCHPFPLQKLSVKEYVLEGDQGRDYLNKWEITVRNRLQEELERCIEVNDSWKVSMSGKYHLPWEHVEEILHHHRLAHAKASHFIGREELVTKSLSQIFSRDSQKGAAVSPYSGVSLAVIGASGTGKTALLSKLASLVHREIPEESLPPVILRFCGTSRYSLHGIDLIRSICLQLLSTYHQKVEIEAMLRVMADQKYEEAVTFFTEVLRKYPVLLFIDSLDQLSNRNEARRKLSFLHNLVLPPQSKVIVSTLPDEYDLEEKRWKYRYFCDGVLTNNGVPIVEMKHQPTDEATVRSVMEELLARRQRRISEDQWLVLLRAASEEPTMLYMNLSLEVICKWRSWEREKELRPTVKGLINQIFEDLEIYYGPTLIRYAFGFITFSREGMADNEMKDCLSRQSAVFSEVCQYWQDVETIPLHVWLRVKQAIKLLLTERDNACMKWYHRQLREAAEQRYEGIKKDCHCIMGRYFCQQPLCLTDLEVWHRDSKVNSRKVMEGYTHLVEGELYSEAIEHMCCFEMVCASSLCEDLFVFLSYLSRLMKIPEAGNVDKLPHYYRWLRRAITLIARSPREFISVTASEEPAVSAVKKENTRRREAKIDGKDGNYSSIRFVETFNGKTRFDSLTARFTGHTERILTVAWSPSGAQLASGSADRTIKVWDTSTAEVLLSLEGHNEVVHAVAWDPTGSRISSASDDNTIRIWDAISGDMLLTLQDHIRSVYSIAWSPDGGQVVSGSGDNTLKIWNSVTGEMLRTLEGHEGQVSTVCWSFDGKEIASGSYDSSIRIWNALAGTEECSLLGHSGQVCSVSWSPNGNLMVSGSVDKAVIVWDALAGDALAVLWDHTRDVYAVSWKPDGSQFASVGYDCQLLIWDAATLELLRKTRIHDSWITAVAWSPDGEWIASGSWDQRIEIHRSEIEDPSEEIEEPNGGIRAIAYSSCSGYIAAAMSDGLIKVWNIPSGELLAVLEGSNPSIHSIAWDPNGTKIVCGADRKAIGIWDVATGERIAFLEGHDNLVDSVSWSADGRKIASGSNDYSIKVWDSTTGTVLLTLKCPRVAVVGWSQDSSRLASGSDDSLVKIWDTRTAESLHTLEGHTGAVKSVSWSPNDLILASVSADGTVKTWNPLTGQLLGSFIGHDSTIHSVAWKDDCRTLATGCLDGTLKVWDSSTGELQQTLEGHSNAVVSLTWIDGTNRLASGSFDKSIKIWDL